MQVFKKYLGEKRAKTMKQIYQQRKFSSKEVRKKKDFHKEGKKGDVTASNISKVEYKRRDGLWMVSAESRLLFPIVTTM